MGDGYDGVGFSGSNFGFENVDLVVVIVECKDVIVECEGIDLFEVFVDVVIFLGLGFDLYISVVYVLL